MALPKEKQKIIEKISGKSYRDWEQEVANKEGMELIQGKGEMRNPLLEEKYQGLLETFVTNQNTKKEDPKPNVHKENKPNHFDKK